MRLITFALASTLGLLSGCASTALQGHGDMSSEEMMRHCAMMEQHAGDEGAGHQHDPAQHGGMTHEEMQRQCQMMRNRGPQAPDAHRPGTTHQH